MFLRNCDSLVSTIAVHCPATAFTENKSTYYNFTTDNAEAPCYVTGIPIAGPYTADVITRFPPLASNNYYRNLIATN
jgi:hypothetical protein